MLHPKTKWILKEYEKSLVKEISNSLKINELTATLLTQRDVNSVEEAEKFLNSKNDFHDPFLFEDMEKTVCRIKRAIEDKEKILIYGDYDADGVTSISVLLLAIKELGGIVDFYIPNRFTEGYGPNEAAFKQAHIDGYTLIVTVDTGISGANEVDIANALGMDVIITDHHEVPPTVPNAYAIIHPKKEGTTYPFNELAGAGVSFKLAHAILGYLPTHLLDLVVIGTVADLVPLHDENRLIVKEGIKALRKSNRPGLKALFEISKIEQRTITEQEIGFTIGPRMNAVGRLGDADPAAHLLLTEDVEESIELAEFLQEMNRQRQEIVQQISKEAIEQVANNSNLHSGKALVLAKEGWNPGVIGIVASKLVSEFNKPTIILGIDKEKGIAKGSGRSIHGFDLYKALSECRDILPHFGGHPMAAGMTLSMDDIDQLRNHLNEKVIEQLGNEELIPVTEIDIECTLDNISIELLEEFDLLAPFGMGNSKPLVKISNVKHAFPKQIGSNKNHLKMTLTESGNSLDVIGFGIGDLIHSISQDPKISVIGELNINEWNNNKKPQLMLKDISIEEWQLFDCRGKKVIDKSNMEDVCEIAFGHDSLGQEIDVNNKNIILTGMPNSLQDIEKLFINGFPKRIYAAFYVENSEMFQAIPTREHFKTFYGLINKYGPFSLKEYSPKIAKWQDWSSDTIKFMTKVFLDLDFVIIEDGVITINKNSLKREFTDSKTYQNKYNQLQVEEVLLYSSYSTLKGWFESKKVTK